MSASFTLVSSNEFWSSTDDNSFKKQASKLSKPQLIKICKKRKVSFHIKDTKQQIIKKLIEKRNKTVKKNKKMTEETKSNFSYTKFNKEYYYNLISSNQWIKKMNISKDIIEQISSYSNGKIKVCSNDTCDYEILICDNYYNTQCNIFGYMTQRGIGNGRKPPLPTTKICNKYLNDTYYFNPKKKLSYCHDCSISIKACNDGGFSRFCPEILFEKANNSYHICVHNKKLCNDHPICKTCKITFCGESCDNIVNLQDLCVSRKCSSCKKGGCPKCVPMISYQACNKCEPPRYGGAVWKCHNNPNCN